MSSCNVLPTLTRTDEVTSTSVLTITSTIVTTLPPTTTTITTVAGPLPITFTSVIPGEISTTIFTTTSTLLVTNTQVTTLSGTTCFPGPTPTAQPTTTPTLPTSTSAVETSLSTQPNGSTVTTSFTQTITTPLGPSQTDSGRSDDNNLAAIVGGSVGGGVGFIVILLLIWFFMRMKRRRSVWDGVFNDDLGPKENAGRIPNIELLEPEVIPQPYSHHSSPPSTTPATPYSNGLSDPNYLGRNPSVAPSADYLGYYHPGYGGPQHPQFYPPQQQLYGGIAQDGTAVPPFAFPGQYAQHQYPLNDSIGRAAGQGGYPYHPNSQYPNPYEGLAPSAGPPDGGYMQSNNGHSGSTTPVTAGATGVAGSGLAPRRDVKSPAGPGSSPHPSPTRVPVPVIHLDGALYSEQETPAGREPDTTSGGGASGEEGNRTGGTAHGLPAYTES